MPFYHLPEWVIHGIDRIRHAFYWKGTKDIYGTVCLINWQLICSHMSQGGLQPRALNFALLSIWQLRLFHDVHALWVALIIRYYYSRRSYNLHTILSGHVSPFWRGVLKTFYGLCIRHQS